MTVASNAIKKHPLDEGLTYYADWDGMLEAGLDLDPAETPLVVDATESGLTIADAKVETSDTVLSFRDACGNSQTRTLKPLRHISYTLSAGPGEAFQGQLEIQARDINGASHGGTQPYQIQG